jgi:capsular exopolysaccharide synthesis family protein
VFAFGTVAKLFGLVAGAIIAAAVILLARAMSTRLDTRAGVALATGLPVVGCLPEVKMKTGRQLVAQGQGPNVSLMAETLRGMWLTMRSMTPDEAGTTLLVTSSDVGEGKTFVATSLARRIAADGFKVLLIDSDLHLPGIGLELGLEPVHSLEAVLTGKVPFEDAIVREPVAGLDCLLAAGDSKNPMKILSSERLKALVETSRLCYDFVVLDSPPVLRVADALLMSRHTHMTLFVVQSGRMPSVLITEAINRFPEEVRGKILTVLTRVRPNRLEKADYYGGYGPAGPGTTPPELARA